MTPFFSTLQGSTLLPGSLDVVFGAPGEPAGLDLGGVPPFGGTDFAIGTTGFAAGDSFALRIQVPEPASMALMLTGLLGVAGLHRRRG